MSQNQTIYLKDYQAPTYFVETLDMIVELGEEETVVKTQLHLHANGHPGDALPLYLHGEELELISVALNGELLTASQYQVDEKGLTLPAAGLFCQVDTVVKIKPQHNTSLMGLYKSNNNFCTQCEAEGFRKITYYVDRPDNLAIYTVTIVADKEKYPLLLSNGNAVDRGDTREGKHWVKWHDPFKKSSHLFALVAGKFDVLEDEFMTMSDRKVHLQLFVEPGNLDKAPHAMQALKLSMKWDEETYGREYDLDIFMIVAVSDFNMGAMENKGLNIFNTKYILASPLTATDSDYENIIRVVGHEYFHNWSGNRVGCRDWFQLSLKEGFTVFRDQSFTADVTSPVKRVRDVSVLRNLQFAEDAGPMSHPIRPASYMEINNFYTLTVYEKGAEVIRMLYTLLGPKKFRQATDLYFTQFDGKAVTTEDFVACMQQASGIDLTQFQSWYNQSGTPILTITDRYDAEKHHYILQVAQHTPPTADQKTKQALHIPLRMALLDEQGIEIPLQLQGEAIANETMRVLDITQASQEFVFIGITKKPIPSLLRGFSAPVKLHYAYTTEQLQHLLTHDADSFSRWEAGQLLAVRVLQGLIADVQAGRPLALDPAFIAIYRQLLQTQGLDQTYQAYLLLLPSQAYLADLMEKVDPLAIYQAHDFVMRQLGQQLRQDWLAVYMKAHSQQPYVYNTAESGKRTLKNTCLQYLLADADQQAQQSCIEQYYQANNMTDKAAALANMVHIDSEERSKMIEDFYQHYRQDALVLDKWFTLQAISTLPNALTRVKTLLQHDAFSIKNPNKVRALIGEFSRSNPVNFHLRDGTGYQFLTEQVIAIDKLNPQIAARLVQPLTHWQRFVEPYASLMKQSLECIQQCELSPDTFEVVNKSLV